MTESQIAKLWDVLGERSPETYRRAYARFMCRPQNSGNCGYCPEMGRLETGTGQLPCGQYHCWVDAHCNGHEA